MSVRMKKNNIAEMMEVFGGLSRVLRCCCRDEAFCADVTFHQFLILDAIAKQKEISLADLHKFLSVEKSTTTRLVAPLIGKGLLQREKADHDSRAVKLLLTPKGRKTYRKVLICLENFFQKILRNIPARQRRNVLESVKIFILAIKNIEDGCRC